MGKKHHKKKSTPLTIINHPQYDNPSTWKIEESKRANLVNESMFQNIILPAILANDLKALKAFIQLNKFPIPKIEDIYRKEIVQQDKAELLRYLIKELNYDFKNFKSESTLLTMAICTGAFNCVSLFLKEGFNPNDKGSEIYSPLQLAIMYNKPPIANLLVQHGARFDFETLIILVSTKVPTSAAYLLLNHIQKSPNNLIKGNLKIKYDQMRKEVTSQDLLELFDQKSSDSPYIETINDCNKLVFLKKDHLLPKIIKNGQEHAAAFFTRLKDNNAKGYLGELLNYLTNIYKILVKAPEKYEKYENFLVEAVDKYGDQSFILNFNKFLLNRYAEIESCALLTKLNFAKQIYYSEKVYEILKATGGSIKEKSEILKKLVLAYVTSSNNEEKITIYLTEISNILADPIFKIDSNLMKVYENVVELKKLKYSRQKEYGLDNIIIQGKTYEAHEQELSVHVLKQFQAKKQWEEGYQFLEETYKIKAYEIFKSYDNLDFKYYEFLFNYHKDKHSMKAKEILDYFYDQALRSQDKSWLRHLYKFYEIVIYRELEDQNEQKLSSYLESLKILPRVSYIQSLQEKLEFWLNNLKATLKGQESSSEVENNTITPVIEDIALRLPKAERKSFDEIERLLAFENFEEVAKIDQKLLKKYFTYKKAELEKQKYIEGAEDRSELVWCVKRKFYKPEDVRQVDKEGNWYAAISKKNLNVDKVKLEKYTNALEHAWAHREQGAMGIKYLSNQLELKTGNDDHRLLANKCFKNPEEKYLIIFQDEKPHSQIKHHPLGFRICNDDNLESYLAGETGLSMEESSNI